MERPASQLENMRPSGLKPPSKLPAMSGGTMGRPLGETTYSTLNSRSGLGESSTMAPPSLVPTKHKPTGLPEPPTKRKTLAERAAEPLNPLRSHIAQPQKTGISNTHARTKSQPTNGYRNTSNSSATSNTSISSTTANVGAGSRPPSRQNGFRYLKHQQQEPTPSVVDDDDDTETGVMGKRKGTSPPVLTFDAQSPITLRKTRTHGDLRRPRPPSRSQPGKAIGLQHANGKYIRSCSDGTQESCSTTSSRSSSCTSTLSLAQAQASAQNQQMMLDNANAPTTQRQVSLSTAFSALSLSPSRACKPSHGSVQRPKHRPSLERIKEEASPSKIPKYSCSPSVRHAASSQSLQSTPARHPLKHMSSLQSGLRTPVSASARQPLLRGKFDDNIPVFLTKEKLTAHPAWDTKGRLEDMESLYAQLRTQFASAASEKTTIEETLNAYKTQIQELKQMNRDLTSENRNLTSDLDRARSDLHTTTTDLKQARRDHERDMQDMERRIDKDIGDLQRQQEKELQNLQREKEKTEDRHEREMERMKRDLEGQQEEAVREVKRRQQDELSQAQGGHDRAIASLQMELDELRRSDEGRAAESASQVQALRDSNVSLQAQLDAANVTSTTLRFQISTAEIRSATLEQEKTALISKTHFLEGNQEAQSLEFTSLSDQLQTAIDAREETLVILRREEMLRRRLNATILELKGNIRVFVRTRPLLNGEDDPSRVEYPDAESLDGGKEMVVHAPTTFSATGKERNERHNYAFDRVFGPGTPNDRVFDDCRDLIQSVIDGYNVSILSYGQTGSGKTYGMSGTQGIIPSSIGVLLEEIQRLKAKGWEYTVEASFVEVYNETLNDLLGDAKTWDDAADVEAAKGKKKEKHEIHHDPQTGKTTVTNLTAMQLWPPADPAAVEFAYESHTDQKEEGETNSSYSAAAGAYLRATIDNLLDTAARNRRVAATNSNARSSRSHSCFMLSLKGHCDATSEKSEGVLNLVDLAGSERLKQSGAAGDRMKETQAINKSLSSLGDVIAALGSGRGDGAHVPYRNSKLTYLLQSSLGGTAANGKSSRTLMLLHLSPLAAHWQESRSSLLFGTKVHGTHIGAAKKNAR